MFVGFLKSHFTVFSKGKVLTITARLSLVTLPSKLFYLKFQALPDSAEKPESEEYLFRSREAGCEPADRVDEHGRDQSLLPAEAVAKPTPDVTADEHA